MGNVTLGRYIPLDSPIHKMDPRAKIGAMLLMLVAIFFPAGWIGYAVLFAACTVLILSAKLSFRYVWKSLKPMMVMMCFLLIINILVVKTGTVLFSIGSFVVYSDAVLQTAYIVVRLLLMIMVTTTLTATTKPLDMTLGIEDLLQPFGKIGVPYHEIAMLISIALRFIPDLIDETNRILKAQESRGVDMQEGKLKEKIMAILSLIVPLFVSAFQRAEDLANAMEARGYAPGEPRTRYKVLKMRGTDWLLLGFAAGLLVLMIVFAYAL
ncbi:MAG: energy-coupling factor transporter transmembrane component T [Galactobacillus timonensis]|uniref:energy-coupling factor transporter transmembrane component T family protein n=1 Tax=Galactobacillus timonensis TaxID=2041840 RepID=UPI000C82BFB9|nr:energy-coupling factor transporter transmembrane component T [Galactobacillus timonensis]MDD5850837.1 energy-coupling factor transporter transmembrane component T [Galactobacillus timonensis]MDD6599837.1 energy-coupling factor transporter transmembrane component T [Galactobacillus timonensis]MDD6680197.1 energy-coupling factor transporter transmembrane component T [Galactobacillus timonensis]